MMFQIMATYNSLVPAIMELVKYKHAMINEHLNTKSFKQILESDAQLIIGISRDEAKQLTIMEGNLGSRKHIFFKHAFKKTARTSLMYGLPKVHSSPLKFRPIESQTNAPPPLNSASCL
jgi:hypothetical protein